MTLNSSEQHKEFNFPNLITETFSFQLNENLNFGFCKKILKNYFGASLHVAHVWTVGGDNAVHTCPDRCPELYEGHWDLYHHRHSVRHSGNRDTPTLVRTVLWITVLSTSKVTAAYLWHFLCDYVHMVSRRDVFLALGTRIRLPPFPSLLTLFLLLLLLLLRLLLLPALLLQLHVLVRHGHPWTKRRTMRWKSGFYSVCWSGSHAKCCRFAHLGLWEVHWGRSAPPECVLHLAHRTPAIVEKFREVVMGETFFGVLNQFNLSLHKMIHFSKYSKHHRLMAPAGKSCKCNKNQISYPFTSQFQILSWTCKLLNVIYKYLNNI